MSRGNEGNDNFVENKDRKLFYKALSEISERFEVGNEFLLIGDCKKDDAPFPTGQRLVMERIVDNWRVVGSKNV